MSQPDLLLYFSDQHDGRATGYAGHPIVETPHMDAMAEAGTAWDTLYTACPLCVPARATLLTSQLPQRTGVYDNVHNLSSDVPTFLHSLTLAGYETVLCGRMHFLGADQRHGFTRRIHGDITSPFGGITEENRGVFGHTFGMGGPVNLVGGGDSPVLAFDRSVVRAALDYLDRDHDHDRPQAIIVGTYGPHFSYVAPPALFEKYRERADVPASWDPEGRDENPYYDRKRHRKRHATRTDREEPVTEDIVRSARAAYFGMIEEQDRLVGEVRDRWRSFLQRSGRRGVMAYASDHGDTCGEHTIFGKQTFYDGSTRVPLVMEGAGIAAGRRVLQPASIMDIGPTLCEIAGAEPLPDIDGVSLLAAATEASPPATEEPRPIFSEWCEWYEDRPLTGRMVRRDKWKLIHFAHDAIPDQLFDMESDPEERNNLAADEPEVAASLGELLYADWSPEVEAEQFDRR
ncbi:MAG: sulfatase-like hydrolase/transferase, partial [Phycisphaeraceae bacterium]